jgi:hypothetical protein
MLRRLGLGQGRRRIQGDRRRIYGEWEDCSSTAIPGTGYGYAVGTGTCNKARAAIYFILTDNGEPGTSDVAEYHIVSSGCTLDAGPAFLLKGNHQFHKN